MIIAIDPSLRSTGIYISDQHKSIVIASKQHEYKALHNLMIQINNVFREYKPDTIIIEMLAYGTQSRGTSTTAEVHGIIKALAAGCNPMHDSMIVIFEKII